MTKLYGIKNPGFHKSGLLPKQCKVLNGPWKLDYTRFSKLTTNYITNLKNCLHQ